MKTVTKFLKTHTATVDEPTQFIEGRAIGAYWDDGFILVGPSDEKIEEIFHLVNEQLGVENAIVDLAAIQSVAICKLSDLSDD